jgi:parallel beta-helix repeat protein
LIGKDRNATIIDGKGKGEVISITSDWVNITGFTISNGSNGLVLNLVSNNSIINNIISLTYSVAIRIASSTDNKIIDNIISDNQNFGVTIYDSSFNKLISNNLSTNCDRGVILSFSSDNVIIDCIFADNGIFIEGDRLSYFNTHTIPSNNILNGRPIYYYKNESGIIINGLQAGQFILANCSNFDMRNMFINNSMAGIEMAFSDNITLSNITINNNLLSINHEHGIYIYSSSDNKIINSHISKSIDGLTLDTHCNNNTILGNNIHHNSLGGGINLLYSSSNNAIYNNEIYSNGGGIGLGTMSDNNLIENNEITDNWEGIHLLGSNLNVIKNNNLNDNFQSGIQIKGSSDNEVINNSINSSGLYGIDIYSASNNNTITQNNITYNLGEGISISSSSDNVITKNNISYNGASGIFFDGYPRNNTITYNDIADNDYGISFSEGTHHSLIMYNTLYKNKLWGIYIDDSSNNLTFHHNNFMNNTKQVYFNKTSCTDISWDDGRGEGNYWSDYQGLDDGSGGRIIGDGVGDTEIPHPHIDQGDGYYNLDNFPLMNPWDNYMFLYPGWNLISIPVVQIEQDITKVLGSIDGLYDAVQWYNSADPSDPWMDTKVSKPFGNELSTINESIGFWIHITESEDIIFLYNGTLPSENQTVTIYPGWNMVGYPSLTNHNRTTGLNNLTFDTHVDCIQWFDTSTKTWHFMGPDDNFVPGRGYWVHSKVEAEWEVPL